jgi:hypothetical protein
MTVQLLALVGLVIGVGLYALLVRRRGAERLDHVTMSRALSASNEIALARMRDAPRARAAALAGLVDGRDLSVHDRDAVAVAVIEDRRAALDRTDVSRGSSRRRRWGRNRRKASRR